MKYSKNVFDVLGIEEENRETSKHLITQYRKLEKKFPNASIWLAGDINIYVNSKVVGNTNELIAVEENNVI